MTDWAVAILRTGSEKRMHDRCREMGVESYCPMLKRKRRAPGKATRERYEEPALSGYLPVRAAHVEASETREELYREPDFYDFIRDITHEIATMDDEALNPLRAMENAEPVKFISGPMFYLGEIVKVPYGNSNVSKAFWSRKGQVVNVWRGSYCLALRDEVSNRTLEVWFSGCQLLKPAV